jgi:predicted metalloprotease with PDZ domain
MRSLLENHGLPKPGFTDAQLKATFEKAAGGDLTDFFNRYVRGNQPIDFNIWLNKLGLRLDKSYLGTTPYADSKTDKPGALGLSTRANGDRVVVTNVVSGLAGYEGGVNANDELVAIDGVRISPANTSERRHVLNELYAGQRVKLTVFRREKLMVFDLTASIKPFDNYKIIPIKEAGNEQIALRRAWLNEQEAKP